MNKRFLPLKKLLIKYKVFISSIVIFSILLSFATRIEEKHQNQVDLTVKSELLLVGKDTIVIEVGSNYTDPGAIFKTSFGDFYVREYLGDINIQKLGTYQLLFEALDPISNINMQATRTVKVADLTKPVITLNGTNLLTVNLASGYKELGAVVTDNYDNNLVVSITTSSELNKLGTYDVYYDAIDSSGNKAITLTRKVRIVEEFDDITVMEDVITLLTIDINPSLAIVLNDEDSIIATYSVDENSEKITKNINLKNLPLEIALQQILEEFNLFGFFENNDNPVLIGLESNSSDNIKNLQEIIAKSMQKTSDIIGKNLLPVVEIFPLDKENASKTLKGEKHSNAKEKLAADKAEDAGLNYASLLTKSVRDILRQALPFDVNLSNPNNYFLTRNTYPERSNIDEVCAIEYGQGAELADWNNIKFYFENYIETFLNSIGLPLGRGEDTLGAYVTQNGNRFADDFRHFFIERHNGTVPGGWAVYDDISNNYLSLGSFFEINLKALCYVTPKVAVNDAVLSTGISLSDANIFFNQYGATEKLIAKVEPSNVTYKNVVWQTEDRKIATVNNFGLVTAVSNGATKINAYTGDGLHVASANVRVEIIYDLSLLNSYVVTANRYRETIDIENACKVELGTTAKLADWNELRTTFGNNIDDLLRYLNVPIGRGEDTNGLYVKVGSSNFYFDRRYFVERHDGVIPPGWLVHDEIGNNTLSLGSFVNINLRALCKIEPPELASDHIPVSAISIKENEVILNQFYQEVTLNVEVLPNNASNQQIIWRSSNSKVASVDNGKITALSNGLTVITVRTIDGSFTASINVEVLIPLDYALMDSFVISSKTYPETSDLLNACITEFGTGTRLADWDEIKTLFAANYQEFFNRIGLNIGRGEDRYGVYVTRNSTRFNGARHYFIERHEGIVPAGWLVHDSIDNNFVSLGSFYSLNLRVLCVIGGSSIAQTLPDSNTNNQDIADNNNPIQILNYPITYVLNNGQLDNPINSYNSTLLPLDLSTPERPGFDFLGWFNDPSFSGMPILSIEKESTGLKRFYAKWQPNPSMKVVPNQLSNFMISSGNYSEKSDLLLACKTEFGNSARLADWTEVKSLFSSSYITFADYIGLPIGRGEDRFGVYVTNNGVKFNGNRHYFIERHNGVVPGGWAAHDQIGNNYLSLGSFVNINLKILCVVGTDD